MVLRPYHSTSEVTPCSGRLPINVQVEVSRQSQCIVAAQSVAMLVLTCCQPECVTPNITT